MGAFAGSISLRRYRVLERPGRDFVDTFTKGVRAHTLVPLNPKKNPHEEKAIGWCSIHDADDLDLQFDKFWLDGRLVLSLRVDVIKPPGAEVKRLVKQRAAEVEAKQGAPLSRSQRLRLKEQVQAELRTNTPPKVKTTDMVWSVDDQKLFFFSQSKGQNELFTDLFLQTFGIPLDVEGPGAWAVTVAEEAELAAELGRAAPTVDFLGGFSGLRPGTRDFDDRRVH